MARAPWDVCGACDAPWTDGHVCEIGPASHLGPPLRARIQRLDRETTWRWSTIRPYRPELRDTLDSDVQAEAAHVRRRCRTQACQPTRQD
jgi:hypothetical protein